MGGEHAVIAGQNIFRMRVALIRFLENAEPLLKMNWLRFRHFAIKLTLSPLRSANLVVLRLVRCRFSLKSAETRPLI
jgi:hypothetical protein